LFACGLRPADPSTPSIVARHFAPSASEDFV
jgi:hypothetical protein